MPRAKTVSFRAQANIARFSYNIRIIWGVLFLIVSASSWSGEINKVILRPKVLVVNYDPIIRSKEGQRLHEVCGWNDPRELAKEYIADIKKVSWDMVNYEIGQWIDADEFPAKLDKFRYTEQQYLACFHQKAKWHMPDACDYIEIIRTNKITQMVDEDKIDEVWLFGAPYFGWFESCMAGKGAFYINGTPLPDVQCNRAFVIMGFNYERGVDCMLEDFCHRTETTMEHVFGGWKAGKTRNDWERFTLYDRVAPGKSACGSCHWAPNSKGDYDWGNKRNVWSTCDDWLNYPNLAGKKRKVNCEEWGNGDQRQHHLWWLLHLPKTPGKTNDKLNNWWLYVINFNENVINKTQNY